MPNVAHDPHASVDESVDGTAGGSVGTRTGRIAVGRRRSRRRRVTTRVTAGIGDRRAGALFDRDVDTRRARRENRSSEERSGDDDHGEPSTLNGTGSHDVSVVDQAMLTRSSQSSLK